MTSIRIDRTRLGYIITGILILAILSYGMTPAPLEAAPTGAVTTAITQTDAILSHIHLDDPN